MSRKRAFIKLTHSINNRGLVLELIFLSFETNFANRARYAKIFSYLRSFKLTRLREKGRNSQSEF